MVRTLRTYLANFGLNEVVNYSLGKIESVNKYQTTGELVKVLKPMSADRLVLRQSLINGLVDTKVYNLNHNNNNINLFEIGKLIDETTVNGAKVWRTQPANLNTAYLYVLNNYWHTNYKAYQGGHFDFTVELLVEKR